MSISVFDLFTVGIGPSSSHTVGPMRAARTFVTSLREDDLLGTTSVRVELFGSLGATGRGHGSDTAVLLGLLGERPETVDPDAVDGHVAAVRATGRLRLPGGPDIAFREDEHLVLHRRLALPRHPNGMQFTASGAGGELRSRCYYSVGGGFVVPESEQSPSPVGTGAAVPLPFRTAEQLLAHCRDTGRPISQVARENERTWRTDAEISDGLLGIWGVMQECVERGCSREGTLPGGLRVQRRARAMREQLLRDEVADDPLRAMEWVNLFALAVNEENAAGGRVVTAPTNGAAGIVPAVLHYYTRFVPGADDDGVVRFLLVAGAIASIFKQTASISGAEVGCQGEVGSACSMAAGALCEVLGGSPAHVENAAEIGLEHNLGLTCDPVGGLVQIPCIERNAIASVKAINAARMAVRGDGRHVVSLDQAVKTMRETGADMKDEYKETSRGGLAVNVVAC